MSFRVAVRVKPGAKSSGIERLGETLVVRVSERAEKGKANAACARALAEHFAVPPSRVRLVRGAVSREKLFEIG